MHSFIMRGSRYAVLHVEDNPGLCGEYSVRGLRFRWRNANSCPRCHFLWPFRPDPGDRSSSRTLLCTSVPPPSRSRSSAQTTQPVSATQPSRLSRGPRRLSRHSLQLVYRARRRLPVRFRKCLHHVRVMPVAQRVLHVRHLEIRLPGPCTQPRRSPVR